MSRDKVLELFFSKPLKEHYFREIVRESRVSPNIVQRELKSLQKEGLLSQTGVVGNTILFKADRMNPLFKELKLLSNLKKVYSSQILSYLDEQLSPRTIILIGSYRTGTDTEESDVDLVLLVAKEQKEPELNKFVKIFQRRVNLHQIEDLRKVSENFQYNLINGIILKGYLNERDISLRKES